MKLIELAKKIVNNKQINMMDKGKVLELAIAEYIAKELPIPTTPLTEKESDFFLRTHKVSVLQDLAKVNEFHVIDLDQTCDVTYHMWQIRYLFVHDVNNPKIERLASLMLAANNEHIPNYYRDLAKQYPNAFFSKWDMKEV